MLVLTIAGCYLRLRTFCTAQHGFFVTADLLVHSNKKQRNLASTELHKGFVKRNRLLYRQLSRRRQDPLGCRSSSSRRWRWQRHAEQFGAATWRLSSRQRRRPSCVGDNINDRIGPERTNDRASSRERAAVACRRATRYTGTKMKALWLTGASSTNL